MKRFTFAALILFIASTALAGQTRTYQVTGPILEVKGDMVIVQKDKEKWEVAIDKETQVKGNMKPGAKVTIQYQMKAKSIEVK